MCHRSRTHKVWWYVCSSLYTGVGFVNHWRAMLSSDNQPSRHIILATSLQIVWQTSVIFHMWFPITIYNDLLLYVLLICIWQCSGQSLTLSFSSNRPQVWPFAPSLASLYVLRLLCAINTDCRTFQPHRPSSHKALSAAYKAFYAADKCLQRLVICC